MPTVNRCLRIACLVMLVASPLAAQPPAPNAADFAKLQADLAGLREEVAALRAALGTTRPAPDAPVQAPATVAGAVTPEMLELVKSQVEEQAQVKVESGSRMAVKLSGTILTNTFVNSGEANWLENPNWVGNPSTESGARGSFSATARQSRIGLETSGITIGSWQAGGTIIADFYGGVPGFQTGTAMGLPRLLYAFGRVESGRTAIEIGQDHAILAPRDPTSLAALSFPLLFRSGNLYLRVPQARVEQQLGRDLTLTMGIVAPIAGDASGYDFAPAAGAGERSVRPAFEGRLGFARGSAEMPRELSVGVSGHYGWRRPAAAPSRTEAWAAALDFNARAGRLGAAGELFAASNAEPFGGGIGQAGRAHGGWAEGRIALTGRTTLTAGFGRDQPSDALGRVLRQENRTIFSSAIVQLTPELAAALEYRWLRTELGLVPAGRENHHVNAVFAVKF